MKYYISGNRNRYKDLLRQIPPNPNCFEIVATLDTRWGNDWVIADDPHSFTVVRPPESMIRVPEAKAILLLFESKL